MDAFPEDFKYSSIHSVIEDETKQFRKVVYDIAMDPESMKRTYASIPLDFCKYCYKAVWNVLLELKDRFPQISLFKKHGDDAGSHHINWTDPGSIRGFDAIIIQISESRYD